MLLLQPSIQNAFGFGVRPIDIRVISRIDNERGAVMELDESLSLSEVNNLRGGENDSGLANVTTPSDAGIRGERQHVVLVESARANVPTIARLRGDAFFAVEGEYVPETAFVLGTGATDGKRVRGVILAEGGIAGSLTLAYGLFDGLLGFTTLISGTGGEPVDPGEGGEVIVIAPDAGVPVPTTPFPFKPGVFVE